MSLHLNFEPHSWYMGAAIRDNLTSGHSQAHLERPLEPDEGYRWSAYLADGNAYQVRELHADTLHELKQHIKGWHKAREARDRLSRQKLGE